MSERTRERLETELRLYQEILKQVPEAILIVDTEGIIQGWFGNAEKRFGYTAAEAIGKSVNMIRHPNVSKTLTAEIIQSIHQTGQFVGEIWSVRKDGSEMLVEATISAFHTESGEIAALIGINRDITEQKRNQNLHRLQSEVLELIAQGAQLTNILDTLCVLVEQQLPGALCLILLLDEQGQALHPGAGPNMPPAFLQALDGLTPGEHAGSCGTAVFRGQQVVVEDAMTDPIWANLRDLADTYDVRSCWSTPFFSKNGRVLGTFAITYDTPGKPAAHHHQLMQTAVHLAGIATERKREEELLLQSQKLESLGVLAGGIAHDFNNLLVAMLGQTTLALAKMPPENPARLHIEKAVRAAERASDLTRQMLAFSGRGHFEFQHINLNILIQESTHLFEAAISHNVRLTRHLADDLPFIEGDVGQIQQVMINLILNAAESIDEPPGVIKIITGTEYITTDSDHYSHFTGESPTAGHYVKLEIHDDGHGMAQETISRIFDPFYTTKETGRGLGLSTVLGIVRGHKGGLQVRSDPGMGTIFTILFPVAATEQAVNESTKSEPQPGRRSPLVLVIDDEEPVREAITDIMELEGIRVITAASGQDGITLFHQQSQDVDLILLDLSMPGLAGEETFRILREIDPTVQIVLSSGYSEVEVSRRFTDKHLAGFIQKPYHMDELVQHIRGFLQAA